MSIATAAPRVGTDPPAVRPDLSRLAPEALQAWRDRLRVILEDERGEIIN